MKFLYNILTAGALALALLIVFVPTVMAQETKPLTAHKVPAIQDPSNADALSLFVKEFTARTVDAPSLPEACQDNPFNSNDSLKIFVYCIQKDARWLNELVFEVAMSTITPENAKILAAQTASTYKTFLEKVRAADQRGEFAKEVDLTPPESVVMDALDQLLNASELPPQLKAKTDRYAVSLNYGYYDCNGTKQLVFYAVIPEQGGMARYTTTTKYPIAELTVAQLPALFNILCEDLDAFLNTLAK